MGLNDLISTPFGQPMVAGRRATGRPSARVGAAARRLGLDTPEGRAMNLKKEQMRLNEGSGAWNEEKRALWNMGNDLKLAIAAGGLDPEKDIQPLRGTFFDHVASSTLSVEEKEGIRNQFLADFDDLAKGEEEAQDRALKRQANLLNIKQAEQGLKLGKLNIKEAQFNRDKAQREEKAQKQGRKATEKLQDVVRELQKEEAFWEERTEIDSDPSILEGYSEEEKLDYENRKIRYKGDRFTSDHALDKLEEFFAENPSIVKSEQGKSLLNTIYGSYGGDRDWIRSQQDKAAGREFALKQQVIAQGVATGLELDIDDNLPKLVKDVAAGIKKRYDAETTFKSRVNLDRAQVRKMVAIDNIISSVIEEIEPTKIIFNLTTTEQVTSEIDNLLKNFDIIDSVVDKKVLGKDNKIQIIESPLKEKYSKQRTIINGRAKAITGDVQSSENRQEIIAIITQIKGILLQYSKDAALESIRQSNWAPPTGTSFDPSIIPPVAD